MRVSRDDILSFLRRRQAASGGFTSADLTKFARERGLFPYSFSRRVLQLVDRNPAFQGFRHLGQRAPSLTLEDYSTLCDTLQQSPLTPPSVVVANLNRARQAQGLPPIPERTAFRVVEALSLGLPADRNNPLSWFQHARVPVSMDYDVAKARASLETHFSWSGLSTPYGVSLRKVMARLNEAEALFATFHPGLRPHLRYEEIRPRAAVLPDFLASTTMERAPAVVARFSCELQMLWLVEARDFLLDQLRIRKARLQQGINARLLRQSFDLLQDHVTLGKRVAQEHLASATPATERALATWAREIPAQRELARAELRLGQSVVYERLLGHLSTLTRGFHVEEVAAHTSRATTLLDLVRGTRSWEDLSADERTCLGKNRRLLETVRADGQEPLRRVLLIERLVEALARGKITLTRSWAYQDLGRRVAAVPLPREEADWPLPPTTVRLLLDGSFPVDLAPLREVGKGPVAEEDEEEEVWTPREGYSELALEVHREVLARHPEWFEAHRRVLEEAWDGAFRMEYKESAFTERLLLAIGFLGRNCRVRDDPSFVSLRYFVRRYVTPATLDTELRFYHDILAEVVAHREEALLVDTLGVEGRRTHALSTYHPRYHTRGFADLRGVGSDLVPAYSLPCSATDTEAMHAVEMVARARRVVGEGIRLYGGNGHTVSRVSAGLLFGAFGVVSAGHIVHEPPPLTEREGKSLLRHLGLLNRVFLLLRQRPELGRLFSSRSHIYVEGVNVRRLVDRLGCLVIQAVTRAGHDWTTVQPYIESGNRLKRLVRIFERGVTRVEPHRQGVSLMAAELILTMVAVRNALRGEEGKGVSPMIDLEGVALFRPT
jgi:hypothetical protein